MSRGQARVVAAAPALALCALAACGPAPSPGVNAAGPATEAAGEGGPGDADEQELEQIAAIERAVNEYATAVHTCWAIGASADFRLEGVVILGLTIGPGGQSTEVTVVRDEPKNSRLTDCLVALWSDVSWPPVFAEGDRIQLPPFDFVAPAAQYFITLGHVEPRPLPGGASRAWVVLDEASTGNADAAMSVLELAGGIEIPLHRHSSAELLYVLAGEGVVYGLDGPGKGTPVTAGSAVYIAAGTAHGFVHRGDEPLTAVQLYAPAGPEQRFKTGEATGTTPVEAAEVKRPPRRFARPLVRATAGAPTSPIAEGKGEIAILFDEGSAGDKSASLGALTGQPGMTVPAHRHADSSEYLFLLAGEGKMVVQGSAFTVQAGDAIQIPRGVEHSFVATGEEPVKALQFYTPGGPEQRFRVR